MKEVEIKAHVADLSAIKKQLVELGCNFSDPLRQEDRVYLQKGLELADTGVGLVALRIRNSNGTHILTLKQQQGDGLDKLEHEVTIDDPQEAHAMLLVMGYHEVSHTIKIRIKAQLRDMEICLDDVQGLGSFIEIEKMTEESEGEKVQNELFAFAQSLGVHEEDRVYKGYDLLLADKNNI